MYTTINFKTKKALKDAVKLGRTVEFYQPGGIFDHNVDPLRHTNITLEGPHYPEPHRWYATAVAFDGKIVSVK